MGQTASAAAPVVPPEARACGDDARFRARWMALGLLLILVAAWRSEGFLNADEHFQVLEFAGWKLGRTPVGALAWEHRERMRPWLQPGLYTLGARGLAALGVEDPFAWAFAFRLFSGLVAWLGLVGLSRCAERWFADEAARRLAVRALVLLYFVPFLAVRTSGESLSTSCFVLALCLVVLRGETARPGVAVVVGALLGLSFGLRYAAGVMVASLLAWMAIVGRAPARRMASVGLGLAAALALGVVVDRWGYGEWTLAPWNYVAANFGRDIAASRFGAEPWYGYAMLLARGPFGAINLLLALAAIVAWVRHPRHVLTWSTAPLALVHCAIAHKEARFLIPLAMLCGPLLALAVGAVPRRGWARWAAGALLAYDVAGLTALCLLPAQPAVPFQRFASRRFPGGAEALVASPRSPWVWRDLTMFFYAPPPPGLQRWPGAPALLAAGGARFDLLTSTWDPLPPVEPYECRALYRSAPEWLSRRGWPRAAGRPPIAWDMYRCVRPGTSLSRSG
jgi:phosphatidylinositol glycan class B